MVQQLSESNTFLTHVNKKLSLSRWDHSAGFYIDHLGFILQTLKGHKAVKMGSNFIPAKDPMLSKRAQSQLKPATAGWHTDTHWHTPTHIDTHRHTLTHTYTHWHTLTHIDKHWNTQTHWLTHGQRDGALIGPLGQLKSCPINPFSRAAHRYFCW